MIEVALASREVHPFAGGGIGTYVNALARVLRPAARVTIVTSASHEPAYRRLAAADDERIPDGVRFVFARDPAPGDEAGFDSWHHAWSTRLYEAIVAAFPGGGPDLAEFHDYTGEGAVTAQASHARDPALRNTRVCMRISSTAELCSMLDGHLGHDFGVPRLADLERISLRHADAVLWGGGDVLRAYRDYYGADAIAPAHRVRHALWTEGHERGAVTPPPREDGRLRLLYLGRLERRKGVQHLLRAVTAIADPRWHLTLVGADTETAPLRTSMRAQLEDMAAGDPRIAFIGPQPRRALRELILSHHLLVVPSLWECWPGVALEALAMNRPLVGTPTGGLTEIVRDGSSGWAARGNDADSLHETLSELVANRPRVNELIASGGPRRHGLALTDPEEIRRDYARLAAAPRRHRPAPRRPDPLVSVVIPYFRLHRHVGCAVAATFAQTHRALEVIVVNDGSFEPEDGVLAELAARYPLHVLNQPNGGVGPARNAGIAVSRGRYVFPLDADNEPEPDFVARCVALLEADPAAAYVTSWSRFVDEDGVELPPPADGYRPLGNLAELRERNAAGDAAAVLRRSLFLRGFAYSRDVTAVEDWLLYRELREAGLHGAVIPAPLMRYRVRGDSMLREVGLPHRERIVEEMDAHERGEDTMAVVERLTLEAVSAHTPQACQHLHRYELATELCEGLDVLDLACGTGYGAAILRRRAASVVGVDRDVATVDAANATVGRTADVAFEAADAAEYLRRPEAARFDAIVCFEGLEHFDELDDCLASLRRLAEAGTRLVLSVPNSAALGEENEFHRTDFDLGLVESKLASLGDATILFQHLAEGSLIQGADGGELAARSLEPERGEPEWAQNFIALVGFDSASAPALASSRSYLTVAPNHTRYMIGLERANQELWRVNARLGRERLGRFDTAAVGARLRESAELDEANARAGAAEERARAAEQRAAAAEAALARAGAGARAQLGHVLRRRLRG